VSIRSKSDASLRLLLVFIYLISFYAKLNKVTSLSLSLSLSHTHTHTHISKGEKNTRRGSWIVLAFSSFSLKLKDTDQKQFKNSFWSDVQNKVVADKNRERRKKNTNQLYRFLPQTESSPVPLALPRRVH